VRSYFAEIVFSKLYPEFEFISAGVKKSSERQDLSWRTSVLSDWGFEDPQRSPRMFESVQDDLVEDDIIVLLDLTLNPLLRDFISSHPKVAIFGESNQFPSWANTFDPYNMSDADIKLAIARALFVSHKLLWDVLNVGFTNSSTIYWRSSDDFMSSIDSYCVDQLSKGTDIFFPRPIALENVNSAISQVRIIDFSDPEKSKKESPAIWMPKYEHPSIERLLLSKDWKATFEYFRGTYPMKVIGGSLTYGGTFLSTPLIIGNITKMYEEFLP